MKTQNKYKNPLLKDINLTDGKTSPAEIIRETAINFSWGFAGNSIVVFMSKGIDMAVLINFILYYIAISYIVNRARYETRLGRFVILPGSAAIGAFSGYKFAQFIASII
jgi:hypothetical protein